MSQSLHAPDEGEPNNRRRWFQYRLRTLLVVVLVASLLCSWLGWKLHAYRAEHRAAAALTDLGASIEKEPALPSWLRKRVSQGTDEFFQHVVKVDLFGTPADDSDETLRQRLAVDGHHAR